MPLAKRFKLGLASCWGGGATSYGDSKDGKKEPERKQEEEPKPKPYDFTQHPEHADWSRAVAASAAIKHLPSPEDAMIPWSHVGSVPDGAEVCTLNPVSGAGRATLFLRTTFTATVLAKRLKKDFAEFSNLTIKNIGEEEGKKKKKSSDSPSSKSTDDEDSSGPSPDVMLVPEAGGSPALVIEAAPGSYMYGPVLALTSTTTDAQETLEYLESIFHTGYACILPHGTSGVNIRTRKGNMRLTKRTGVQEVEKKSAPSGKSLATIFELEFNRAPEFNNPEGHEPHGLGDKTVARAVIAYRDASGWPSLGPTFQSLEVRRDYHGSGLVQDLFNAIEGWFTKFWTLDTIYWNHRCLKATHLQNLVMDRTPPVPDVDPFEEHHVLTDKKFFYEVMHFSLNYPNPTDPLAQLEPDVFPEAHAIKFYPGTGAAVPLPTVEFSSFATVQGWRSCDNCRIPEEDLESTLLVCGDCRLPVYWRAHYCSRECQKEDWDTHKLCCGKTHQEVCIGKEALEERILAEVAAVTAAAAQPQPPTTPFSATDGAPEP
ncbi:unnamed protein product [Scytosiphon promiscuus]